MPCPRGGDCLPHATERRADVLHNEGDTCGRQTIDINEAYTYHIRRRWTQPAVEAVLTLPGRDSGSYNEMDELHAHLLKATCRVVAPVARC